MTFRQFEPSLFEFLAELRDNNDRTWFKAHQPRYERDVREPVRAFVRAMGPRLAPIAPRLVADDRKVGGSMMRPQRDTRFGTDKTPYKTHVGIQFRHDAGKDVHAPGLYVHLDLDEVFMGHGMWRPESSALKKIREGIVQDPKRFAATVQSAQAKDGLYRGDLDGSLKTAPRGFPKDHPMITDLRLKSHILVADLDPADVCRADFPDRITELTRQGADHARWLCEAIGLPWT